MPEYRQDPLTGRTVLVAEERAARPHQFDIETEASGNGHPDVCPFCEGNEALTPEEIDAFRPSGNMPGSLPGTRGWTVRVVPNKFPAVARRNAEFPDLESFQSRYETPPPFDRLFHRLDGNDLLPIPGVGNHEVIVDTPRHVLSVTDMTVSEVRDMFKMYGKRLVSLRKEGRWAFVQIFKNVGAAAGASIPHAHSQLVAMPFVPPAFLRTLQNAARYAEQTGSDCFWCDMLRFETAEKHRIIEETPHSIALCPFVSRFAAEVEIHPKRHEQSLEEIDDEDRWEDLARLVRRTVFRMERSVPWMKDDLSYNFVLHTEPFAPPIPNGERHGGTSERSVFHWHLSILPSLARAAGFEWGTGLHINPIPPEKAAAQLRSVVLEED